MDSSGSYNICDICFAQYLVSMGHVCTPESGGKLERRYKAPDAQPTKRYVVKNKGLNRKERRKREAAIKKARMKNKQHKEKK